LTGRRVGSEAGDGSLSKDSFRGGIRAGIPFAVAAGLVGASFGVLAEPVMGPVATLVMSALVFAGAAQFGALAVLAGGGGAAAAIAAAVLLNARFITMGVALAPSLRGGPARRAGYGQTMIDAAWALANRGGSRFDADFMVGATLPHYPLWVGGTAIGVLVGEGIADPQTLGLDALFPAFFLALLWEELRGGQTLAVAGIAAALALALLPFTPPGIPVIAASAAALVGLFGDPRRFGTPSLEGEP
jgi:4-azaleucine resistance transporter AzlC